MFTEPRDPPHGDRKFMSILGKTVINAKVLGHVLLKLIAVHSEALDRTR